MFSFYFVNNPGDPPENMKVQKHHSLSNLIEKTFRLSIVKKLNYNLCYTESRNFSVCFSKIPILREILIGVINNL